MIYILLVIYVVSLIYLFLNSFKTNLYLPLGLTFIIPLTQLSFDAALTGTALIMDSALIIFYMLFLLDLTLVVYYFGGKLGFDKTKTKKKSSSTELPVDDIDKLWETL